MDGAEGAGNPWAYASAKRARVDPLLNPGPDLAQVHGLSAGSGNNHGARPARRYDPLLGMLPPQQIPFSDAQLPGIPGAVRGPRRRPYQPVAYEHPDGDHHHHPAQPILADDEDDERPKRYRKGFNIPDVIGKGEQYTHPDDWTKMKEIKAKGSVRSEPIESAPFEALKRYVREAGLERPVPAPDYFSSRESVNMYITTLDYVRLPDRPENAWGKDGAVVRLFGVTEEGHSAAVMVHNFWPYMYANVPEVLAARIAEIGADGALEEFRAWLDLQAKMRDPKHSQPGQPDTYVRKVRLLSGSHRSIYFVQLETGVYIEIECQLPRFVPLCRDILSKRHMVLTKAGEEAVGRIAPLHQHELPDEQDAEQEALDEAVLDTENPEMWMLPDDEQLRNCEAMRRPENRYGRDPVPVYECDIPFVLRFLVDKELSGCGWISVPRGAVECAAIGGKPVDPEAGVVLGASTQVSCAVDANKLVSLKARADVPDEFRTAMIDIEAATSKTRPFPVPSDDPIICMAVNLYKIKDGMKARARIGFSVGQVDPVKELSHSVQFCADESWSEETHSRWSTEGRRDMLLALRWLLAEAWDYDVLLGYNLPFDQAFCNKQADALHIGSAFRRYTRMSDELCQSKVTSFSSKALGTRNTLAFPGAGRTSMDVLDQAKRDGSLKLRSYKLNNVAMEVAGVAKHEMPHQQIGPNWMMSDNATPKTRAKVLKYNANDSEITAMIFARKAYLWNAHAAAQTTGVTIDMLMHRGAGIKSVSQLLRAARANRYLMPTYRSAAEKRSSAGFGVVPEGTMIRYEREINEELRGFDPMDMSERDTAKREQEAIDRVNQRFGIDPLLFSYKDACRFATTAPGHEAANFGHSFDSGNWYCPDAARAKTIATDYEAARKQGGRLLLFFVNYVDPQKCGDKPGKQKFYGVAQVLSAPDADTPLSSEWRGVSPSPTFKVRWVHKFSASDAGARFNPDIPWRPSLSATAVPLQVRQARLLLDLCRLRRAVPKVELNLQGKPIEATTIEAYLKRRRRRDDGDDDDGGEGGAAVDREIADEFDLPDYDGDESVDDDDDKYEGAVVLETIVGLYRVPISTLDFASLYPSIIILHNLCYCTTLTRELIRRYNLKESDRDPATGEYVDPPNNDYTIKDVGHIVANPSLVKGIVPRILEGLLGARGVSKVFMGSAGKLKGHLIDRLNKKVYDPSNWSVFDEYLVAGNGQPKGESFVQIVQKLQPETRPILDRLVSQWVELKARYDASQTVALLKEMGGVADKVRLLLAKADKAGAIKDALARLSEALKACFANIYDDKLRAAVSGAFTALSDAADRSMVDATDQAWADELKPIYALWEAIRVRLETSPRDTLEADTRELREALLFEVSVLHQLFDARQNALKIAANSMYGFAGARVGKYPMRAIAETTTAEGRKSINKKRDLIERMFPLPKRNTYGPTLRDWEENPLIHPTVLESARKLSREEFDARLADSVPVRTKREAYGATREEWEANKARIWEKDVARMRSESNEEFDKHLKELEENGMRPIVIGGDTDSIFICWPHCYAPTDAHTLSQEGAKFVNKHFRKPQETTYEKTYFDALYNAQKKYVGVMWEPGKPKPKQEPKPDGALGETQDAMSYKGIEVVRRDATLEVCDAVSVCLRKMLVERKVELGAAYAAKLIELHRTQRADMSKLVMSKSLSKEPQDYNPGAPDSAPIHAQVAMKVNARNTGEKYNVGDRVRFFVTQPDSKGAKTGTMGEDTTYTIENNLALNTNYYLDQLRSSLRRIFEPVSPGIIKFLFDGVPLANGRLLRVRSAIDGTKEETLTSGKDRPKELKHIKPGRQGSEYEPSNVTLRWARKMSAVDDSKIEEAVKRQIESMREEIGFGHVPWDRPLILDKNWQQLDPATVRAELPLRGTSLQATVTIPGAEPTAGEHPVPSGAVPAAAAPRPKSMGGLAGLGAPRKMCTICWTKNVASPRDIACAGCKSGANRERLLASRRAAEKQYEQLLARDEEVWRNCAKCAETMDNAVACMATECEHWTTRKSTTINRARAAARRKMLEW